MVIYKNLILMTCFLPIDYSGYNIVRYDISLNLWRILNLFFESETKLFNLGLLSLKVPLYHLKNLPSCFSALRQPNLSENTKKGWFYAKTPLKKQKRSETALRQISLLMCLRTTKRYIFIVSTTKRYVRPPARQTGSCQSFFRLNMQTMLLETPYVAFVEVQLTISHPSLPTRFSWFSNWFILTFPPAKPLVS